ncbi:TraB/GumN family protein [Christensenellaceae bacterium OttesenSCG-928-L17]|nr:TraB/GumN family protein [Christensenellaceae bacterium OttesenSCG-928-L17]
MIFRRIMLCILCFFFAILCATCSPPEDTPLFWKVENGDTSFYLFGSIHVASKEKKVIADTIKNAEKSVEAMKVARKSMLKYNSSFAEGLQMQ